MPETAPLSWLSLLPALVTIGLAFATRQVVAALFAGVLTGSAVLFAGSGRVEDLNFVSRFFLPAIGSPGYAQILLIYLWCLGGLIGIWERTGSARHFAQYVGARLARTRERALFFAWVLGCVFHQGGTVSTVLTGSTVKPVADAQRVSHEELAYVVDSTASPIATLLPFNAWPAYVGGLVVGTIPLFPDVGAATDFFFSSLPFNFYAVFAVMATLGLSLGRLPWMGSRLKAARDRTLAGGPLDRPGAQPMLLNRADLSRHESSYYTPAMIDFLLPLAVLIGGGALPLLFGFGSRINEAFMAAVISAMVVAGVRGLALDEIIDAFVQGCSQMTIGAIVLGLAVTVGSVSKELDTAAYLVSVVAGRLDPLLLPGLLTFLCMAIAFATGTSWGTYAVVFPVALPLAYSLDADPTYIHICFGAVLGGAVFGDQCSPISDTTILSSMFSGCDLMDHVQTQLPLALVAAALGALASTLATLMLV